MTTRLFALGLLATLVSGCVTLDAINPFSGKPKAKIAGSLPSVPEIKPVWKQGVSAAGAYAFSPAVVGGSVFVAGADGEIQRLESGAVIWRTGLKEPLSGGVGADVEHVAVGTPKGDVVLLDAKTGKEQWRARTSSEILAAPVVADDIVVVRSGDSRLYAFDAANGKRRWVYQRTIPALTLRSNVGVVVRNGKTYAGFPGGKLIAIANGNGAALWDVTVALPRGATELERVTDITSEPVVTDQFTCAVAYQGKLACFDTATGNGIWSRDISSSVGIDARDNALVVSEDSGVVQALALSTGASLWKQDKLEGRGTGRPLNLARHVVVADESGMIHWLDSDSGAIVGRGTTDGSGVRAALARGAGGWIAQSINGTVYQFPGGPAL